jgi:hypothetical protein
MISFHNCTPDQISIHFDLDKEFELPQEQSVDFNFHDVVNKKVTITNLTRGRILRDWRLEPADQNTSDKFVNEKAHYFLTILAMNDRIYMQMHDSNPHEDGHECSHEEFLEGIFKFDTEEVKEDSPGFFHKVYNTIFGKKAVKETPLEMANREYANILAHNIHPIEHIAVDELSTLKNRKRKVAKFIHDTLNVEVGTDDVPHIALTFSGGGMRAMMTTAAALDVMKRNGILDMISYISCLSGSTWAVAPWLLRSSMNDYNVFYPETSKCDYYKMGNEIPKDEKPTTAHFTVFKAMSFAKNVFHYLHDAKGSILGKPTLTHLWGLLIGYEILKNRNKHDKKFAELELVDVLGAILEGDNPIPVFTASFNKRDYYGPDYEEQVELSDDKDTKKAKDLGWISMSPFTSGSEIFSKIIDSPKFGNLCQNIPLYRLIGIWGSAFTTSLENMTEFNDLVSKIAHKMLSEDKMEHALKNTAEAIYNYSPHDDTEDTKIVQVNDGGLRFNIPLYPLFRESRRKCHLSVVFDASAGMQDGAVDIFGALQESVLSGYDVGDALTTKIKLRIARSPRGHVIYFPVNMNAEFMSGQFATLKIEYNQKDFDTLYAEVDRVANFVYQLPNGDKKSGIEIIKDEVKNIIANGLSTKAEVIEIDTTGQKEE